MNLHCRNVRSVFRFVGLAVALSGGVGLTGPLGSAALGQCLYEVALWIPEGPPCSDGNPANFLAGSMDEEGNIAGSMICSVTPQAAGWRMGEIEAFYLTGPPNVNGSGAGALVDPDHIVGEALPSGSTLSIAAYWEFGVGRLLDLPPGANTSSARGINRTSQIVGRSNNGTQSGMVRAFLWESDLISILELPLGPNAEAGDINDLSQITGWMGGGFLTDGHAYIWDDGSVIDLGVIPGGNSAQGLAINRLGHVVGRGWVPDGVSTFGNPHAFYWDGKQAFDLGTLPDHKRSRALDINDLDQIIGNSSFVGDNPNVTHAFFWQDGVLYNLDDLVVTDLGSTPVTSAGSINNKGWILAGTVAGTVLLKPVGSAPGDIDNNCVVNVQDLLLLLGEWGNANSIADTNEDGIVNVLDLLDLLRDWG